MAKGKKKNKKNKKQVVNSRMTAVEQRELEANIRQYKGKGFSDLEILEKLNLQPHVYKQYLQRIYDIDREDFEGLNSVKVFTDFSEKSRALVKELDRMQKRFDYRKQFTALVACIKQKHEINKDRIKLGQQLGFIDQKANEVSVETEMTFSTMSTEEVQREVQKELNKLNEMAHKPTVEMRPELMNTLGEDEADMKRFVPSNISISEEDSKPKKRKTKVKTKVKLKRRS